MGLLVTLRHDGAQVLRGFDNHANYDGIYAERYLIRDLTPIIAHARDIRHKPTYQTLIRFKLAPKLK